MNKVVLFDLDGTLVDSAAGILGSLRAAFDEIGLEWPGFDRNVVGPPLYRTLPRFIGDEATAAVIPAYRRNYAAEGLYDSPPFPGIPELLVAVQKAGARIAVATSKAEPFAAQIVAARGWTDLFATVCGDTLAAERPTKADVISEALSRLGESDAVMIGDRNTDVVGALQNSLPCIGAGWGYGQPEELVEAVAVAATPEDLLTMLLAPAS